ncbi:MAG: hypothetical protein AB8F95_21780 [Bacteroidia bacterium]
MTTDEFLSAIQSKIINPRGGQSYSELLSEFFENRPSYVLQELYPILVEIKSIERHQIHGTLREEEVVKYEREQSKLLEAWGTRLEAEQEMLKAQPIKPQSLNEKEINTKIATGDIKGAIELLGQYFSTYRSRLTHNFEKLKRDGKRFLPAEEAIGKEDRAYTLMVIRIQELQLAVQKEQAVLYENHLNDRLAKYPFIQELLEIILRNRIKHALSEIEKKVPLTSQDLRKLHHIQENQKQLSRENRMNLIHYPVFLKKQHTLVADVIDFLWWQDFSIEGDVSEIKIERRPVSEYQFEFKEPSFFQRIFWWLLG